VPAWAGPYFLHRPGSSVAAAASACDLPRRHAAQVPHLQPGRNHLPLQGARMTLQLPTLHDLYAARIRLRDVIVATPILPLASTGAERSVDVWLKCENLQRTGSFKIRGAYNRIATLSPEQRAAGVVAYSSGNHAQGVACAAAVLGVSATVVMPEGAIE